ncbi:MAG: hypothetical protein KAG84_01570 [Bacteroidales bacterium]|nr:hypothetical protein [Bacteroidales bacterium]
MYRFILILLIVVFQSIALAQFSIGISISGLGYHPEKEKYENTELYKWKLDKKGNFVAFSSLTFFLSYRFNDYLGAKIMQSIVFSDCAGHFAGITHFGVDLHDDIIGFTSKTDQLSMSFGPFLYYRKNWNTEDNYQHDAEYMKISRNGVWESKFVWYGGQIEYSHLIKNNQYITVNFLPAIPYLYTLGVGAKYLP